MSTPISSDLTGSGVRALLVGTGSHALGSVLGTVAAVEDTVADLKRTLVHTCGMDPAHVQDIIDPGTPSEVIRALEKQAGEATRLLLFYYVGHAIVPGSELHLATYGTQKLHDRVQSLPFAEVRRHFERTRAASRVVILDCCHSARAQDGQSSELRQKLVVPATQGVYLMASAARDEQAWAPQGQRHTVFTGALLKFLAQGDDRAGSNLTLDGTYRYLRRVLPEQGFPSPHCQHSDTADSLILAPNPVVPSSGARPSAGATEEAEICPYLGLKPFSTDDAPWFHGRTQLTRSLVSRLGKRLVDPHPLVVAGASGSGKSSLLRAGLLPALARGDLDSSDQWPTPLLLTPSVRPLANLAAELSQLTGEESATVRETLAKDPAAISGMISRGLDRWAGEVGNVSGRNVRLVIVVDQFEAVFAHPDHKERQAFISALSYAAQGGADDGRAALVVLAVRSDYIHDCVSYPEIVDALQRDAVYIQPMTAMELRQAIEEPARLVGLDLEEGLADRLLQDIGVTFPAASSSGNFQPGCLPLLSHALQETWHQRNGNTLTLAGYQAVGGIDEAIASTADATFSTFTAKEKEACRELLLRLVRFGPEQQVTRRTVRREQLETGRNPRDSVSLRRVLESLIDARLVTVDHGYAELAHEALIEHWPSLKGWINADYENHMFRQHVNDQALFWSKHGRSSEHLETGLRLANIKEWFKEERHSKELSDIGRVFIEASIRSERLKNRRKRLPLYLGAVLVLVMIASVLVVMAFESQRSEAVSRLVAVQADQMRETEPSLSMLLSLAAYRIADTPEARSSLINSSTVVPATRLTEPGGVLEAAAVDPDREILAMGGDDKEVQLQDISDPHASQPMSAPLAGPTSTVFALAYREDGSLLAAGGGDQAVHLWDTSEVGNPRRLPPLTGPEATVYAVAFGKGGDVLVAGSDDTKVYVWDVSDLDDLRLLSVLQGHEEPVRSLAFQGEADMLATGGEYVALWDLADATEPELIVPQIEGSEGFVDSVAFSEEGSLLAAGVDGTVPVWDLVDAGAPQPFGEAFAFEDGLTGRVKTVAFSSDGTNIAAGTDDNKVMVWNTTSRDRIGNYPHPGPVTAVSFVSDDTTLLTTASDGIARLWSLDGPVLRATGDRLLSVAFSPDGDLLAAAGVRGTVYVWDRTDPYAPILAMEMPGFDDYVASLAFSPDGRLLVAGSVDSTLRVWDMADPLESRELATVPDVSDSQIEALAFSPDGRLLATGGNDHTVRLWSMDDPEAPQPLGPPLTEPENYVWTVAFSPSGRTLAAGSVSGVVHLWDVSEPEVPRAHTTLDTGNPSYVYGIEFSPDGETLASARAHGAVELWDLSDTGKPNRVESPLLEGFTGAVQSVAFSPDGGSLAVGLANGTSRIWDVSDLSQPRDPVTVSGPENTVWSMDFDPSGTSFASASLDGTVRVWDTDLDRVADYICTVTSGEITRVEWEQFVPDVAYMPPC